MTAQVVAIATFDEARRLTDRIRLALDRVATSWADLAERVAEAYERRADLALGYGSWEEYATTELKPAEGIAAHVRRELVGLLSARGMGSRAIAPVVGVTDRHVRRAIAQVGHVVPPVQTERIDHATGEVLAPSVTGLDGKTYTRPEPQPKEIKEKTVTAAPRLALPQPPKYGGNRLNHSQIINNAVVAGKGMRIILDEITELDQSITNEEAERLASGLSELTRSLKRINSLLTKKATS